MPLPNTIEDRVALFHYTMDRRLFGVSYLFPIRNIDFGVIMPQGDASSDMAKVMDNYWHYVQTECPGRNILRTATYEYGTWHLGPEMLIDIPESPTEELKAHLNSIVKR